MNDQTGSLADRVIDSAGTEFNPEVHIKGRDGQPRKSRKGKFIHKPNRNPVINIEPDANEDSYNDTQGDSGPTASDSQNYAPIGKVVTASFITVCMIFGGPEWKPEHEETEALEIAFTNYFEAKGISDIPPEYVLVMAVGSYAGKRIVQPVTQSRLRKFWNKVRGRQDAQSDTGNNYERQNNTSDAPSY